MDTDAQVPALPAERTCLAVCSYQGTRCNEAPHECSKSGTRSRIDNEEPLAWRADPAGQRSLRLHRELYHEWRGPRPRLLGPYQGVSVEDQGRSLRRYRDASGL